MPAPAPDYVLNYSRKIGELLKEAGGGNLDRDIATEIGNIERFHHRLGDLKDHRMWISLQSRMGASGRKLIAKIPKQVSEFRKAREFLRHRPNTTSRLVALDRTLNKLNQARHDLDRSLSNLSKADLPSAGFRKVELDPAGGERHIALYHPGPKGIGPAPFRFTGPAGSEVAIEMAHVNDRLYGGHQHLIAPQHLGTFENMNAEGFTTSATGGTARFRLREGGPTQVWYQPSDVCARRKITLTHTLSGAAIRHVLYVDVCYAEKLYDLFQYDLPYLELYQGDPNHRNEDSHYASMEMLNALQKLDQAYGMAFEAGEFDEKVLENGQTNTVQPTQPRLMINDISLPWGGTFKYKGEMQNNTHETHRWGNDVDINWSRMNGRQRIWLGSNAPYYFSKVALHGKEKDGNIHWHLDAA